MLKFLAVGAGGFLGAVSRYLLNGWMHRKFPGFLPAGTLLVNVIGCLAIGVLMGLVIERRLGPEHELIRVLLITGFLGSLTTFSTFAYETVELIQEDQWRPAIVNVSSNLVLGLAAVWLGRLIVRGSGG